MGPLAILKDKHSQHNQSNPKQSFSKIKVGTKSTKGSGLKKITCLQLYFLFLKMSLLFALMGPRRGLVEPTSPSKLVARPSRLGWWFLLASWAWFGPHSKGSKSRRGAALSIELQQLFGLGLVAWTDPNKPVRDGWLSSLYPGRFLNARFFSFVLFSHLPLCRLLIFNPLLSPYQYPTCIESVFLVHLLHPI